MRHPLTFYYLDGQEVKPTLDAKKWSQEFERAHCIVAQTDVGSYWVSTVFIGIDHNFFGDGPPLVFETMIFRNEPNGERHSVDGWIERASTWDEAALMHVHGVAWAQQQLEGLPPTEG